MTVHAGTSKARVLATIDLIRASVATFPEPACRILEESNVLQHLRTHLATLSNAAGVWERAAPLVGQLRGLVSVGRRGANGRAR